MSDTDASCALCGAPLPAGARFCPACGAEAAKAVRPPPPPSPVIPVAPPPPLAPAAPPPPPAQYGAPAPPRRSNATVAVVLILVGLLFIGLVAIAGIAAWTTLGTRTHSTVTQSLESLTNASETHNTVKVPQPAAVTVGDSTQSATNPPVATPVEQISLARVGEGEHIGPVESGDQAAALVINLPDVQEWVAAIDKARAEGKKRTAMVTVERKPNGHYLVHLFENVEDDEPGHTATFGWYDVDNEGGAIKPDNVDGD